MEFYGWSVRGCRELYTDWSTANSLFLPREEEKEEEEEEEKEN